jgi:hypothetical protein
VNSGRAASDGGSRLYSFHPDHNEAASQKRLVSVQSNHDIEPSPKAGTFKNTAS